MHGYTAASSSYDTTILLHDEYFALHFKLMVLWAGLEKYQHYLIMRENWRYS